MMGSTPTQYTVTSIPPAAVRWRGSSPFGDPLGTPSPDYSPRPCGGAFAITIHTFAVFGLYGGREAWYSASATHSGPLPPPCAECFIGPASI